MRLLSIIILLIAIILVVIKLYKLNNGLNREKKVQDFVMKNISILIILIAIILVGIRLSNPIRFYDVSPVPFEHDPLLDSLTGLEETTIERSVGSMSWWNLVHIGFILLVAGFLVFIFEISNKWED